MGMLRTGFALGESSVVGIKGLLSGGSVTKPSVFCPMLSLSSSGEPVSHSVALGKEASRGEKAGHDLRCHQCKVNIKVSGSFPLVTVIIIICSCQVF